MTPAASITKPVEPLRPPRILPPVRMRRFPLMLPRFLRNPLACIPREAYEEPIVVAAGPPRRVFVCDPELVKIVLLEKQDLFPKTAIQRRVLGPLLGNGILLSQGDEWRWQRHTVAPLFRHSEILDYVPAMAAAAQTQIAKWRASDLGLPRVIEHDMSQATYEVISQTMLAGGGEAVGAALGEDRGAYLEGLPWSLVYAALGIPEWLPRPLKSRMRRREARLRAAVRDLVQHRRAEASAPEDLLARLLAARRSDSGAVMSDEEMVDTLLTFLLAGHDTTAKALTWALYLLSRSPTWEDRVMNEIASAVPAGPVAAASIEALPTVLQVVKETLRLYPPAPETTRIATIDMELGGVRVEAGTIIDIPIYAIHRHRRLWHDPDTFDPDRFSPEEEAARPRYQFIPFGAGPRICIGASFALVEATVMLAMFLREFRFRCPAGFEPTPISRLTLAAREGMPMILSDRHGQARAGYDTHEG
jgi:cytochrome P450